jgi:hypothetical protein
MVSRTTVALLAGAVVLAAASSATAQFAGGGRPPREGACFYQDINYRGQYFCAEAGDDLSTMPSGANDRVSSIRILGGAEVRVYEDPRFRGDVLRFDADVHDLQSADFNDVISSVQIESRSFSGIRGRNGRPSRPPNPDAIVRRAYQDVLERDPDPVGMRTYRSHIIDDGWTEQEVRDSLRQSPEYREKNTMTRAKAEAIVRNAYLAVFNREPDAGSRGYVVRVFRDKWTQQDVERELRQSPEYRNNAAGSPSPRRP